MADHSVLYAAVYDDVDSALADLDTVEQMYSEHMLRSYGAAVIDNEEGGGHVVRRIQRPDSSTVSDLLGTDLPSEGELEDAATTLHGAEACLVMIADPDTETAFDEAVARASTIAKRDFDADVDEITDQMKRAFGETA